MTTILDSPSLVTLAAQATAAALAALAPAGWDGRQEAGSLDSLYSLGGLPCDARAQGWVGEALLEVVSAQVLARMVADEQEHLLVRVRRRFDFAAARSVCAGSMRWAGRQGQPPTYAASKLLWALVAGQLLGLALRRLEDELRHNLLLRWFCGFALHERTPDHSTLGRFDLWLRGGAGRALFEWVLAQIEEDFAHEQSEPQIGDTFALRSRAANTNRTHLLRMVCRRLLSCLQTASPPAHGAVQEQLAEHAPSLFGEQAELRDEQLTVEERNSRECLTACGAALCLALVRKQVVEHAIPLAAFATSWAGQESDVLPAEASSPEQQQRRRLDNWLDVLDKILADEFI